MLAADTAEERVVAIEAQLKEARETAAADAGTQVEAAEARASAAEARASAAEEEAEAALEAKVAEVAEARAALETLRTELDEAVEKVRSSSVRADEAELRALDLETALERAQSATPDQTLKSEPGDEADVREALHAARAEIDQLTIRTKLTLELVGGKDEEIAALQAEVERLQASVAAAAQAPAASAAPVAVVALDPSEVDLGPLVTTVEAHRGHVDKGFETWMGVQVTLGKAIKELLVMAQKEPEFGPTVYPMLDSLKEITDSGMEILSGSRSHLEQQAEVLKAISGAAEG